MKIRSGWVGNIIVGWYGKMVAGYDVTGGWRDWQ